MIVSILGLTFALMHSRPRQVTCHEHTEDSQLACCMLPIRNREPYGPYPACAFPDKGVPAKASRGYL